jgi:hypothetical protein
MDGPMKPLTLVDEFEHYSRWRDASMYASKPADWLNTRN